jgi:hypothetical protein
LWGKIASDVTAGVVYDVASGKGPSWEHVGTDALYGLIGGVGGEVVGVGFKAAARGLRGLRSTLEQVVEGGRKMRKAGGGLPRLPDIPGPSHAAGPSRTAAAPVRVREHVSAASMPPEMMQLRLRDIYFSHNKILPRFRNWNSVRRTIARFFGPGLSTHLIPQATGEDFQRNPNTRQRLLPAAGFLSKRD